MGKIISYFFTLLVVDYRFNLIAYFARILQFIKEFFRFRAYDNKKARASFQNIRPYLSDNTKITSVEPIYFYQDIWLASKIFASKPKKHIDVASNIKTIGLISQFVPTEFVDIRPPNIQLANLKIVEGSITKLPYRSNSVNSLSSICVIEHIGLGRYGDMIDSFGSEKACRELWRVLAPGGNLYISIPIGKQNLTLFNAQRTFTKTYLLSFFDKHRLISESYIASGKLLEKYNHKFDYTIGLYHVQKIK